MLDAQAAGRQQEALAGATPFLRLMGIALGGALLVKGALACRDDNSAPARNRRLLATYFAAAHLPETAALRAQVEGLAASVLAFDPAA